MPEIVTPLAEKGAGGRNVFANYGLRGELYRRAIAHAILCLFLAAPAFSQDKDHGKPKRRPTISEAAAAKQRLTGALARLEKYPLGNYRSDDKERAELDRLMEEIIGYKNFSALRTDEKWEVLYFLGLVESSERRLLPERRIKEIIKNIPPERYLEIDQARPASREGNPLAGLAYQFHGHTEVPMKLKPWALDIFEHTHDFTHPELWEFARAQLKDLDIRLPQAAGESLEGWLTAEKMAGPEKIVLQRKFASLKAAGSLAPDNDAWWRAATDLAPHLEGENWRSLRLPTEEERVLRAFVAQRRHFLVENLAAAVSKKEDRELETEISRLDQIATEKALQYRPEFPLLKALVNHLHASPRRAAEVLESVTISRSATTGNTQTVAQVGMEIFFASLLEPLSEREMGRILKNLANDRSASPRVVALFRKLVGVTLKHRQDPTFLGTATIDQDGITTQGFIQQLKSEAENAKALKKELDQRVVLSFTGGLSHSSEAGNLPPMTLSHKDAREKIAGLIAAGEFDTAVKLSFALNLVGGQSFEAVRANLLRRHLSRRVSVSGLTIRGLFTEDLRE